MNDQPRKIREGFVSDEPEIKTIEAVATELPPLPEDEVVVEKWPITVKLLYKPIRNDKGDMVKELTFREPRGGDINRYGNPCRVNQDGDVLIEEKKMSMIMAALCGINLPFLEGMDPRDWNSCAFRLRGFFCPILGLGR